MTKEQKQLYSVVDKAKGAISGVENFAEELIQQFEQEREAYGSMKNLADAAIAEAKGKAAFSAAAADVWKRKAKMKRERVLFTENLLKQTLNRCTQQAERLEEIAKQRDRYQQLADENASLWDKAQEELRQAQADHDAAHTDWLNAEDHATKLLQKINSNEEMLQDMEQQRDEARAQAAAAQSAENEARGHGVMWMLFAAGGWCIVAAGVIALLWGEG